MSAKLKSKSQDSPKRTVGSQFQAIPIVLDLPHELPDILFGYIHWTRRLSECPMHTIKNPLHHTL